MGPPGSGKSDLVLRLVDRGFMLVADDQVEIDQGMAAPAPALAGLLEVRGLGIVRMSYRPAARLALVVDLIDGAALAATRLPSPARHTLLGLPVVGVVAACASAPLRVALALDCALGAATQVAGAFA
jgi:HPr kinase/phosphorylase